MKTKVLLVMCLVSILCIFILSNAIAEEGILNYFSSHTPVVSGDYQGTEEQGCGVKGEAIALSGLIYGVYGNSTNSDNGIGVYGFGRQVGVKGCGILEAGVYGESTNGIGVEGKSDNLGGKGVSGECNYIQDETFIVGASGELGSTHKVILENGSQDYEGIGVQGIGMMGESDFAAGALGIVAPFPSENARAAGVVGIVSSEANNNVFGVYGMVHGGGENSYAIYADGKMKVTDNLTVGENLIVDEKKIIPYEGYRNLALDFYEKKLQNVKVYKSVPAGKIDIIATGEAEYKGDWTSPGQFALKNLYDGRYGYWDKYEWATQGLKPKPNVLRVDIEMTFDTPVDVDKIVAYFRPNPEDIIRNVYVAVYSGDVLMFDAITGMSTLGGLGKPTVINQAGITKVVYAIVDTADTVLNVGLAELEIWGKESQQD